MLLLLGGMQSRQKSENSARHDKRRHSALSALSECGTVSADLNSSLQVASMILRRHKRNQAQSHLPSHLMRDASNLVVNLMLPLIGPSYKAEREVEAEA